MCYKKETWLLGHTNINASSSCMCTAWRLSWQKTKYD